MQKKEIQTLIKDILQLRGLQNLTRRQIKLPTSNIQTVTPIKGLLH
jgi:hypothetical protein